jgi:hypothetical protein
LFGALRCRRLSAEPFSQWKSLNKGKALCSNNAPTAVTDQKEYTIVSDSNNMPAVAAVGFWEFTKAHKKEFVVDIFFLATDSNDNNKTHLYVHELIPPKDDWVLLRFPEDLTGCNELLAPTGRLN